MVLEWLIEPLVLACAGRGSQRSRAEVEPIRMGRDGQRQSELTGQGGVRTGLLGYRRYRLRRGEGRGGRTVWLGMRGGEVWMSETFPLPQFTRLDPAPNQ